MTPCGTGFVCSAHGAGRVPRKQRGKRSRCGNIIGIVEKAHVEDQISMAWDAVPIGTGCDKNTQSRRSRAKWPVNRWFKSAVLREEVSIIRSARSRSLATTSGSSLMPSMPDGLGRADVVVSSPYSAVRAARHPTCTTTAGHHGPSIAGGGGTANARRARGKASRGAEASNGGMIQLSHWTHPRLGSAMWPLRVPQLQRAAWCHRCLKLAPQTTVPPDSAGQKQEGFPPPTALRDPPEICLDRLCANGLRCFRCFYSKLSATDRPFAARILDRRRRGERKKQRNKSPCRSASLLVDESVKIPGAWLRATAGLQKTIADIRKTLLK